jgi:hypothetical protein
MARRSSSVTQADITRLIKAALAAGVGKEHIVGVRLDRDGATVLFGEQKPVSVESAELPAAAETTSRDNSWSEIDAA